MAITSFSEANIAITTNYLALKQVIPESAYAALDEIVGNPVLPGKVSEFLEFGYKHRDKLTTELKEAVVSVGQFAYENGFYGLGVDGRGYKLVSVINGTMTEEEAFPVA